ANDDTPRQLLVDVLTGQYQGLTRDPAVDRNIAALAAANTFTVTTGHQLCLFTGPLYFLYKIMTAINLSAQLNAAHPDQHVVPVYWMASEDHDFAEINHAFLFNRELSWETGYGGMVGEIATESLRPVLDELGSILGEGEVANELRQLLEEAYAGQANLSDATRHLVNRLFGAYGVVVIDANDPRLKAHFVPVMEDDLFAHSAFQQASETKRHLEEQYKLPVNPREINLFYCRDGQRERIVREGNTWSVLNAEHAFTEATLRQELADHPERFSPNVVLRPLYQEQLLPNLAYIGGPSEVAYWLELKGVFEHYKTNFPMVLLRNMVLLVNATMQKRMAKLDLSAETLFEPADALIARLVKAGTEASLELTDEKAALDALYAGLVEKAVAVDPTLKRAVEGEHQKQLKA
ncbi:MAG: bacillithiol biosynthesis cysteine-adding enzyme BshC, partial [Bacteroidota bacterium]